MTSYKQRSLDLDIEKLTSYRFEDGRYLEVEMLREAQTARYQLQIRDREYRGLRSKSPLHLALELRFTQGRTIINAVHGCPICSQRPVTHMCICRRRKPMISLAQMSCGVCQAKGDLLGMVIAQEPETASPPSILPLSYISALHAGLPKGAETRYIVDAILSTAGFPPADEITPENAVRFFNSQLPLS